ncbi:MAG: regulatory protein RecX [Pontimonas sp.]
MSVAHPEGERDAIIIPFPLHRVTQQSESPHDSVGVVHDIQLEDSETPSPKAAKRAHNVSLHALSGKSYSEREMRHRLRSRELAEDVIEAEIEELQRTGLINDEVLATDLVERYSGRERLPRRAVEQKLRSRKLSADVIDRALASHESPDEAELAEELARDRLRKMGTVDPGVASRRLRDFLHRKGFSSEDSAQAVARVLS